MNAKICCAAAFQLTITPSRYLEMIASSDDSTMVASRSRASIAACSRASCSRSRSARSLSSQTAANVRPVTETTPKNTSNRTAFISGVLVAKGPEPNAVSIVAINAIKRVAKPAPLTPKRIAAPITNGRTANAKMCNRIGIRGRSPKMMKHTTVSRNKPATNSGIRNQERILSKSGNVNMTGVISNTPVLSPSQ